MKIKISSQEYEINGFKLRCYTIEVNDEVVFEDLSEDEFRKITLEELINLYSII